MTQLQRWVRDSCKSNWFTFLQLAHADKEILVECKLQKGSLISVSPSDLVGTEKSKESHGLWLDDLNTYVYTWEPWYDLDHQDMIKMTMITISKVSEHSDKDTGFTMHSLWKAALEPTLFTQCQWWRPPWSRRLCGWLLKLTTMLKPMLCGWGPAW